MADDLALERASAQVEAVLRGNMPAPQVECFFDEETYTASYVVSDPGSGRAAIVDSLLDFDQASGRTSTTSADRIADYVRGHGLTVDWILETHVHADHFSAGLYLRDRLGGKLAIGRDIVGVQSDFGSLFNEGEDFARDGSQFDRLLDDGEELSIGDIPVTVLHVPGHTRADIAYVVGDAAFVGDTMFMPDYGTARSDFPGGDARTLYRSIRRLMRLPGKTRVFLCHDYKAPDREEFVWETTMAAERESNVHVHEGIGEDEFVKMRVERDATLETPRLLFPAIQVNMRAGRLPEPEENGVRYLKLPLNSL